MKILKTISWMFVAVLLAVIGAVVVSDLTGINPYIPGSVFLVASLLPTPKGVAYFIPFSAPGGAATPFNFNLNFLPQFLTFNNAVALTSLKVQTAEDGVLHDWTSAGITAMANFECVGAITATWVNFRLADGQINGKNVSISGVTSGAGLVPFGVSSDKPGSLMYRSQNVTTIAATPITFSNFFALFIPTMATATDRAEVTYRNGMVTTYAMEELRNMSVIYQDVPGIIINNMKGLIKSVLLVCAAATPVYIFKANISGQES